MSANDELQAHTCEKMLEFYGNLANNVAQAKVQDNVKKSHILEENEAKLEKTTQDVQKKCLSLTEQWKKGKIKKAKYWVKYRNGNIDIWELSEGITIESKPEIIEVLAPVLSFEECKDLKLHDEKATIKLGEKIIENDKLKELLKRCRDFINYEVPDHCIDDVLIDKIDEVLK